MEKSEARNKLINWLKNKNGLCVITGKKSCGKTFLVDDVLEKEGITKVEYNNYINQDKSYIILNSITSNNIENIFNFGNDNKCVVIKNLREIICEDLEKKIINLIKNKKTCKIIFIDKKPRKKWLNVCTENINLNYSNMEILQIINNMKINNMNIKISKKKINQIISDENCELDKIINKIKLINLSFKVKQKNRSKKINLDCSNYDDFSSKENKFKEFIKDPQKKLFYYNNESYLKLLHDNYPKIINDLEDLSNFSEEISHFDHKKNFDLYFDYSFSLVNKLKHFI
jgi:hypothetical protein